MICSECYKQKFFESTTPGLCAECYDTIFERAHIQASDLDDEGYLDLQYDLFAHDEENNDE